MRLGPSCVLGLLDDYATRSGYVMTPVVVWAGPDVVLQPNPSEVLAAYRIGLHELNRDDSPRFVSIPESDRPVVQVPLGGDLIHAPTGAVLVQFRCVGLDGRLGADASSTSNNPSSPGADSVRVGPRPASHVCDRTSSTGPPTSCQKQGFGAGTSAAGVAEAAAAVDAVERLGPTCHSTSSTRWITSWAMRSPWVMS